MNCACELAPDARSFTKLCDEHYSLKVCAMTRERNYCKSLIRAALDSWEPDDSDYGNGLQDALGCIEALDSEAHGLDNNSLVTNG